MRKNRKNPHHRLKKKKCPLMVKVAVKKNKMLIGLMHPWRKVLRVSAQTITKRSPQLTSGRDTVLVIEIHTKHIHVQYATYIHMYTCILLYSLGIY